MDLVGQEMMTEDKVTLRLNFVCQYKIIKPLRVLEMKSFDDQIHIQLQLILREYVGTLKLDDLLRRKEDVASFILSRLADKGEELGVQFLSAGVKDVILPAAVHEKAGHPLQISVSIGYTGKAISLVRSCLTDHEQKRTRTYSQAAEAGP
ncbi:hypothetical protein PCURB6_42270 [Paenibacillus curdlanolyticus]|nr:hypothetical protein PCURB6_42270 [Paenibacillus curdlanolyticus]